MEFTCKECGHLQTRQNTTMKVIDGELRRTGDICEECGGRCSHSNPKNGAPSLGGFGRFGISKIN